VRRALFRRLGASWLALLLLLSPVLPALGEDSAEPDEVEEWVDLPDDEPGEARPATDIFYHTPGEGGPRCDHDICFWNMEMGNLDEDAVWKVLTQPVTVHPRTWKKRPSSILPDWSKNVWTYYSRFLAFVKIRLVNAAATSTGTRVGRGFLRGVYPGKQFSCR